MNEIAETAYAKLNLGLHVRGRLPDGRHRIETVFAFCNEGDTLAASPSDQLSLECTGRFAVELGSPEDNLVMRAARALREAGQIRDGAALRLSKMLPVASGIGGGSADAAAALRLLTRLWGLGPSLAHEVAPSVGSDVPACLLSRTSRGTGAGDEIEPIDLPELAGAPVLLINPRVQISTADVFARWDAVDHGPLNSWQHGRNDLEPAAVQLAPQITTVLAWLSAQAGADFVAMSGSGATCFALFTTEEQRDRSTESVPREWWHLATLLR